MKRARFKSYAWWAAWLILIALATDFYEWDVLPRMWLGHPLWLWRLFLLILLIGLVYALLAHLTWEDDAS
ncbi:hypothetical protein [Thermanaerothrix sp.]|uniref:hypothetical protein n=1 Tax=Thermanaerothrix sp. TaxID=2972675 RepID=UPI002ADE260D|nr:hypothetical protein [Thermanaerothrix sp.]